jgi:hypothetical protein
MLPPSLRNLRTGRSGRALPQTRKLTPCRWSRQGVKLFFTDFRQAAEAEGGRSAEQVVQQDPQPDEHQDHAADEGRPAPESLPHP